MEYALLNVSDLALFEGTPGIFNTGIDRFNADDYKGAAMSFGAAFEIYNYLDVSRLTKLCIMHFDRIPESDEKLEWFEGGREKGGYLISTANIASTCFFGSEEYD